MEVTYKTENHQEIFDFVVEKIVGQGGPSFGSGGVCVYRSLDTGRKCAFGWLIPDSEYTATMECKVLQEKTGKIGSSNSLIDLEVPMNNRKLIRRLQLAHDDDASHVHETGEDPKWNAEVLRSSLTRIAVAYDLNVAIVNKMLPEVVEA